MRVGKKTVDKIEKVCKEFEKYDEEDKVEVEVLRKGTKKVLSVDIDEEQSIHQNFFFRKPNMRMFLDYPFDELEMHLEMDELRPDIENMQIEVEQAMRDLKVNHKKVHGQV
jgi:archaellum component FlaC